eukprot:1485106-Rhodomonas_salina.3
MIVGYQRWLHYCCRRWLHDARLTARDNAQCQCLFAPSTNSVDRSTLAPACGWGAPDYHAQC